MKRSLLLSGLMIAFLGFGPSAAFAGVHTWDVSEVFSNADGTIQFIEVYNSGGNGETGIGNGTISSDTQTLTMNKGAQANPFDRYWLVATQSFADLPGAPTPDFIIPLSKVPFFSVDGDTVDFGPYDSCTFSAAPNDGIQSYDCIGMSVGENSPTNYAVPSGGPQGGPVDAAEITLDYFDDFEFETLQNWGGGSSPAVVTTGGPDGAGDAYLSIAASSGDLGSFNADQWSGDYGSANVNAVEFDLNNSGPDALELRVMLMSPGCELGGGACTAWASTTAKSLASGSGWVTEIFSLDESDMTQVLGSDSHAVTLANAERLLLRHDDGSPDPPGTQPTAVTATLGIDNVTALPEPQGLPALGLGAALLFALRRRSKSGTRS